MNSPRPEAKEPFFMTLTPLTTKVLLPDGTPVSVCAVTAKVPHRSNQFHTILLQEDRVNSFIAEIENYKQFYARRGLGTVTINDEDEMDHHPAHVEVQRMDNFSDSNKYVGTALHEFAFRYSVEKGRRGNVELSTTQDSHLFHYACGFRAAWFDYGQNEFVLADKENNIMAELKGISMFLPDEQIQEKLKKYTPVKSETVMPGSVEPVSNQINNTVKESKADAKVDRLILFNWALLKDMVESCKSNAKQYLEQYPSESKLFAKKTHQCQQQARELIAICDQYQKFNDEVKPEVKLYFILKELVEMVFKRIPQKDALFEKLNTTDRGNVMWNSPMLAMFDKSTYNVIQDLKNCLDNVIQNNGPSANSVKHKDLPKLLDKLEQVLEVKPQDFVKISELVRKDRKLT
jgi:hypothetical protein